METQGPIGRDVVAPTASVYWDTTASGSGPRKYANRRTSNAGCLPAKMETQGPIGRDVVTPHSLSILGHYSLKVWAQEICK
jgi:hypothetical protein